MELPVVACRVMGIPELIEDDVTGRLVRPGSRDALANALSVSRPIRTDGPSLGRAARERVAAEFDSERRRPTAGRLLRVPGPLVGPGRRGDPRDAGLRRCRRLRPAGTGVASQGAAADRDNPRPQPHDVVVEGVVERGEVRLDEPGDRHGDQPDPPWLELRARSAACRDYDRDDDDREPQTRRRLDRARTRWTASCCARCRRSSAGTSRRGGLRGYRHGESSPSQADRRPGLDHPQCGGVGVEPVPHRVLIGRSLSDVLR